MTHLQSQATDPGVTSATGKSSERRLRLATGDLEITVARADLALEDLCDFAARRNPKRGFLFVSKVLGRHLPARPSSMRSVQRRLAEKIPPDLPGPVVLIGLAETAICLGQGVHEEYLSRTGRRDVLFIHTTRLGLELPTVFEFLEEHSHAACHKVYRPLAPEDRALFGNARSAVLVDDEASTGRTLVNLANALAPFAERLESVLCLVLTDWRGPERARAASRSMPLPSSWQSLLEGEYRFTPGQIPKSVPCTSGFREQARGGFLRRNDGRLGLRTPPALPAGVADGLGVSPGARILVLGTGEFSYLPFRLAEDLENRGCEVYCQATTRSPVLVGHAVTQVEAFPDNYGSGVPNYLYNVTPGDYDRIFLCSETPTKRIPPRLLRLGAVPVVL